DDEPLGPMTVHLRWSHDAKLGGGSVKAADETGDPIDTTRGLVLEVQVGALERSFAWSAAACQGDERIVCKIPHRAKAVVKGASFHAAFTKIDLPAQAAGPVAVRLAEGAVTAGVDHAGTAATCTERASALKCAAP